jgi:RimJ/RimL family protein N-acetyltransferase
MKNSRNPHGQPIGFAIENFVMPPRPNFDRLTGNFVSVEPISSMDIPALHKAFSLDAEGCNWTYLPYGPFAGEKEFTNWAETNCFGEDPKFYTIFLKQNPAGVAGFLRIDPKVGCIEIGHIHFSPLLQRTRVGTEALLLMIEWAFHAGYRRVEWKCDALNAPSRHAAQRLGLSFEGIFRQATIYKSRNRDTAWYAATSEDWPDLEKAYHVWRKPENFDDQGKEIKKLSELTSFREPFE